MAGMGAAAEFGDQAENVFWGKRQELIGLSEGCRRDIVFARDLRGIPKIVSHGLEITTQSIIKRGIGVTETVEGPIVFQACGFCQLLPPRFVFILAAAWHQITIVFNPDKFQPFF